MKFGIKKIIGTTVIAILIAVIIVADCILLDPGIAQRITGYLCPPEVDADALAASRQEGQALSKQIQIEGTVLTKNDGVLPLSDDVDKVNVFGWRAIDWVYGGSGSGQVVADEGANIDLLAALDAYDKSYNGMLIDMYNDFHAPMGDVGAIGKGYGEFYRLCEPSINDSNAYTDQVKSEALAYSDTAIVVIGRHAGETEDPTRKQYKEKVSDDNSRHYLEISTEEEELLTYVGANYDKVIVIVNQHDGIGLP